MPLLENHHKQIDSLQNRLNLYWSKEKFQNIPNKIMSIHCMKWKLISAGTIFHQQTTIGIVPILFM